MYIRKLTEKFLNVLLQNLFHMEHCRMLPGPSVSGGQEAAVQRVRRIENAKHSAPSAMEGIVEPSGGCQPVDGSARENAETADSSPRDGATAISPGML